MRTAMSLLLLLLALDATAAQSRVTVSISDEYGRATVEAAGNEPYDGGPWAGLPAHPLRDGTQPTAEGFRIRTWQEGDKTRVVVFAILPRAAKAKTDSERQVATRLMAVGESSEISETEAYAAQHVTLTAAQR